MAGQLGDGLLDVFAFCAGLPISAFSELEAKRPVRFITFTDQELATITQKIPELSPTVIPKGTYRTLTEDHKTVGVFNFFIVHKDLPEDLVYEITKAVLENNAGWCRATAPAKETVPANAIKNTFLPFHPGAVRYYKEKGIALESESTAGRRRVAPRRTRPSPGGLEPAARRGPFYAPRSTPDCRGPRAA
jgi:uncharacterized protein